MRAQRLSSSLVASIGLVALLLLLAPSSSVAQVNPNDIVGGTVSGHEEATTTPLITQIYTVPAGRRLVLTDFEYAVDLTPSQFGVDLQTPVVIQAGATERWGSVWYGFAAPVAGTSARNQLSRSFSTGILFAPGTLINVSHFPGEIVSGASADWRISWGGYLTTASTTEASLLDQKALEGLALAPAVPNPLSSQTEIRFSLPNEGRVTLRIVDVQGRVVRTLTDSVLGAGEHELAWDARNESGEAVASGVYFVDLAMGNERKARKAIVLQ